MHVLNGADIIAITNTGIKAEYDTPLIPGFSCVSCTPRPYDPVNGGVAVYAKQSIQGLVHVVEEHPEFGMTWVFLKGCSMWAPLYIGVCYIPHEHSTYYERENKSLSIQAHFVLLSSSIQKFRAKGKILLAGDFNAHTAEVEDRLLASDWEGAGEAGVELPNGCIQDVLADMHVVPQRHNRDKKGCNKLGTHVIELCQASGLVILNGRLRGDEHGALTFYGDGREATSLIDYFIASPDLCFGDWPGRHNSHMHVLPKSACPSRPVGPGDGNKYFDHVPLLLAVGCTMQQSRSPAMQMLDSANRQVSGGLQWSDDIQNVFAEALCTNPEVQEHLRVACDSSMGSVLENEKALCAAILTAARHVQTQHGIGIIKHTKGRHEHSNTAPKNAWYNDSCKQARRHLRDMEAAHGVDSAQMRDAYLVYKKLVRKCKREWEFEHMLQLQNDMYADPKLFWKAYGGSRKKTPLTNVDEWTKYFAELYAATHRDDHRGASTSDDLFHLPSSEQVEHARDLNREFTVDEICWVLEHEVGRGKSAGPDGIPGEFLKYAYTTVPDGSSKHLLGEALMVIFNKVLREGYPEHWATSALVPVPKPKGDIQVRDDYRGIAVSSAISKVYASCLLRRMDLWAESNKFRAEGQSGFRAQRGTIDAAFTLNHIIEKYHSNKKPVFVAFIDFRKAYDWVDRKLLWRCLETLGMHGECLESLKSMYAKVTLQVRMDGDLGDAFTSGTGVKQGDPLSPLLFGLFIDRVEQFLHDKLPTVGVQLLHRMVQVLLYADDLAIMAETAEGMQQMLQGLSDFCKATGMQVNIKKSEVVVFNSCFCSPSQIRLAQTLRYQDTVLAMKKSFIYLGIIMSDQEQLGQCMHTMFDMALRKAKTAAHMMFRRCYTMGIHNVALQCHLFDTLVRPVLNYGCAVWAPYIMTDKGITTVHPVEVWHRSVLRQSLGVNESTRRNIIMEELDRQPLCMAWLSQVLKFWNRLVARDHHDLARMALQESFELGDRHGWAAHLKLALQRIGCSTQLHSLTAIDISTCMHEAWDKWIAVSNPVCDESVGVREVHDNQRDNFKCLKYRKWFAADADTDKRDRFMYHLFEQDQIFAVAKFRMGSHWLDTECRRKDDQGRLLPRSARICRCCSLNLREDEMHVMECNLYQDARSRYHSLFNNRTGLGPTYNDVHMHQFANGDGSGAFWRKFASFLLTCRRSRDAKLHGSVIDVGVDG